MHEGQKRASRRGRQRDYHYCMQPGCSTDIAKDKLEHGKDDGNGRDDDSVTRFAGCGESRSHGWPRANARAATVFNGRRRRRRRPSAFTWLLNTPYVGWKRLVHATSDAEHRLQTVIPRPRRRYSTGFCTGRLVSRIYPRLRTTQYRHRPRCPLTTGCWLLVAHDAERALDIH